MLEAYRKHVEERAAEGVVPKPLDAEQVAGLVELLKNPPQGEEEVIVSAYKQLKTKFPNLILIIAPRHPQRFYEVGYYLDVQQLNTAHMSKTEPVNLNTDVLYCDTMGQLNQLYGVADIAFIGGSIVSKGGHNPLESARYGVPSLMGPYIYNNSEICDTLIAGGGLQLIKSEAELIATLEQWIVDEELRQTIGQKGIESIEAHVGVLETVLEYVTEQVQDHSKPD